MFSIRTLRLEAEYYSSVSAAKKAFGDEESSAYYEGNVKFSPNMKLCDYNNFKLSPTPSTFTNIIRGIFNLPRTKGRVYYADINNDIVYIGYYLVSPCTKSTVVYVNPYYRNRGYGTELLKHAIAIGANMSVISKYDLVAKHLLEKLGFKDACIESNIDYYKDRVEFIKRECAKDDTILDIDERDFSEYMNNESPVLMVRE